MKEKKDQPHNLFLYCSPDDRAALYIQVYTQTEEILTGEVV